MRVSDIAAMFQKDDGSNNTGEKDRENIAHIFRRLIFNHTPEQNHDVEGSLMLHKGVRISEEDFNNKVRNLAPDQDLVVVWTYYRDLDVACSSGYNSVKKAINAAKKTYQQESAAFPLKNYTITTRAKSVLVQDLEGFSPEYDADLHITLKRIK